MTYPDNSIEAKRRKLIRAIVTATQSHARIEQLKTAHRNAQPKKLETTRRTGPDPKWLRQEKLKAFQTLALLQGVLVPWVVLLAFIVFNLCPAATIFAFACGTGPFAGYVVPGIMVACWAVGFFMMGYLENVVYIDLKSQPAIDKSNPVTRN